MYMYHINMYQYVSYHKPDYIMSKNTELDLNFQSLDLVIFFAKVTWAIDGLPFLNLAFEYL